MFELNNEGQIVPRSTVRSRAAMTIGSIEYERIRGAEHVPREFFCPICSCLLWQPRSCGVCQNLFCEACILKWLQVKQSCPYGCERYEDRRCSPQIRCLLSTVWIRCQSFPYGCAAVLSYDTLEEHQTQQCPCPSTRCQYCENLMLVSAINAHEQECGQQLGNCAKCDRLIPKFLLEKHQLACVSVNSQHNYLPTNNQLQNVPQPIVPMQDTGVPFAGMWNYTMEERYIQEQYYELSWWRRLWRLVCLILTNPFNAPQILITIWLTGYGFLFGCLIGGTLTMFAYCFRNICTSFLLIILLTGLLHSTVPWFLNSVHDSSIMIISAILSMVAGFLFIYVNAHRLSNKNKLGYTLLECVAAILIWKLGLLFIRFYFYWIPAYVTATFIAGVSIFLFVFIQLAASSQLPT